MGSLTAAASQLHLIPASNWAAVAGGVVGGIIGSYLGAASCCALQTPRERAAVRRFVHLNTFTVVVCTSLLVSLMLQVPLWLQLAILVIGLGTVNYQCLVPLQRVMAPMIARDSARPQRNQLAIRIRLRAHRHHRGERLRDRSGGVCADAQRKHDGQRRHSAGVVVIHCVEPQRCGAGAPPSRGPPWRGRHASGPWPHRTRPCSAGRPCWCRRQRTRHHDAASCAARGRPCPGSHPCSDQAGQNARPGADRPGFLAADATVLVDVQRGPALTAMAAAAMLPARQFVARELAVLVLVQLVEFRSQARVGGRLAAVDDAVTVGVQLGRAQCRRGRVSAASAIPEAEVPSSRASSRGYGS